MNKNEFWQMIKDSIEQADEKQLGLSCAFLGYKKNEDIVEIDYQSQNMTLEDLLASLKGLEADGLIELVDTNNMGYLICLKN